MAARGAQRLGQRRVKAPRLQRKSGSGCSGLCSTDTRRRAPRWLSGMQSETRTSSAWPSLQQEWGGGQAGRAQGGSWDFLSPIPTPQAHP